MVVMMTILLPREHNIDREIVRDMPYQMKLNFLSSCNFERKSEPYQDWPIAWAQKKLRLKYWNFQWYQNWVSLAARYRWWSKVDVASRIQENQSHICIAKYRSQCRPVQEMPVQLHNSTSSTWDSWEQLFISLYFQNSDQALSWPTVQFSSVFLILFIPSMPLETLKPSHFTATVKYTWGPLCLCSFRIQCIFLLGIFWLSETLSAFLSLSWNWSNQSNSVSVSYVWW